MQINLIEYVLRIRRFHVSGRRRSFRRRKIYERYLRRRSTSLDLSGPTVALTLPEVTHIDEKDLEYFPPETKLSDEELETLLQNHKHDANSHLSTWGPEFDKVVTMIEEKLSAVAMQNKSLRKMESQSKPTTEDTEAESSFSLIESTRIESLLDETNLRGSVEKPDNEYPFMRKNPASRSSALSTLPNYLFDRIELIVLEKIRAKYWLSFTANSTEWMKLMNYSWYKDRNIVEEDFFLMRVLGRGGFGLVTGTY